MRVPALEVAERIREELRRGLRSGGVSATFGVATYPSDGRTRAELLRAADGAMYLAKSAGKNRTFAPRASEGGARLTPL